MSRNLKNVFLLIGLLAAVCGFKFTATICIIVLLIAENK